MTDVRDLYAHKSLDTVVAIYARSNIDSRKIDLTSTKGVHGATRFCSTDRRSSLPFAAVAILGVQLLNAPLLTWGPASGLVGGFEIPNPLEGHYPRRVPIHVVGSGGIQGGFVSLAARAHGLTTGGAVDQTTSGSSTRAVAKGNSFPLEHRTPDLVNPASKPPTSDEVHTVGLGLLHELRGELLLDQSKAAWGSNECLHSLGGHRIVHPIR